VAFHH